MNHRLHSRFSHSKTSLSPAAAGALFKKPGLLLLGAVLPHFLLMPLSPAAPLQWGGGSVDVTDGTPLSPSSGDWAWGGARNWALDSGPSFGYATWVDGETAVFGATDTPYEINVSGGVTPGGLATAIAGGGGSGVITLQGAGSTAGPFTLAQGGTVTTAVGTTLRILSDPAHALTITTSGFTKTGGGTLTFDTTTVGNVNTAGVVDIQEGTLRVVGDRAGIFANESLTLSGATSVFEAGQLTAATSNHTGVVFAGITGAAGSVIRSTGPGVSHVAWNNSGLDGVTEGVVLTDGGEGSQLGFVKAGSKTLTLNQVNSYTGGTTVYNGRLIAAVGGAVPGFVGVTNTGVFEPAATGVQPYSIAVQAGGKLIGRAGTDYSSVSLLPGAALEFATPEDLPAGGGTLPDWPSGILSFGFEPEASVLNRVPRDFSGVIALAASIGGPLDFAPAYVSPLSQARLGAVGAVTYSGILTPSGTSYRLGGSGTLTLDQTAALTGTRDVDIGSNAVTGRTVNPSPGSVVITGSNDVSGHLTLGAYSTLRLEGSSGSLAGIGSITVNQGTLALTDSVASGSNGNRIADAAPIVFQRGGTITYLGTRGTIEDAGDLTIEAGEVSLSASGAALGTTGAAALRFAGLSSRSEPSTVTFANGTNNSLRFLNSPALTNGLLGGWTITGGANFTDINPSNKQPRQITPLILTSDADFAAVDPASNYTFDSAVQVTTATDRTVNSLRVNYGTGGPFLVDLGPASGPGITNILTLESGGLLLSSNNGGTLAGGSLTAGSGGNYHLYAFTPATAANSAKTLASPVVDNGANPVRLVKAGAGQLILTSENSYSGGTFINNGNLQIATSGNVAALGTGPVSFEGSGSTLSLGNNISPRTIANEINVRADSTFAVTAGQGINVTFSGAVHLAADTIWSINGNVTTLSGPLTGGGSLRLGQGGTYTISGTEPNTFTGSLVQTSGTLTLNKPEGVQAVGGDIFLGDIDGIFGVETLSLGRSHQIADHSRITLSGGISGNQGVFRLNGSKSETIGGLRSALDSGVVENGGAANTQAVLTLHNQTDSSYGGLIRNDTNGDSTRELSLVKTGPATQILKGTNSHNGTTTIREGSLRIDGRLTHSALTVEAGGELSGTGVISQNTAVTGSHRPGPSGAQAFDGALEYGPEAHLVIGLNGNRVDGQGSVVANAALTVNAGAVIDVFLNLPGTGTNFGDVFWDSARNWTVATAASFSGNFALGTVSGDTAGNPAAAHGSFSLVRTASQVQLQWTPSGGVDPLQAWRQTHFNSPGNTGTAANTEDPDKDGISNLLEFVLNTSPVAGNLLPVEWSRTATSLEYHYQRGRAASALLGPVVQWSDDLAAWSSAGITETVVSDDGTVELVTAHVPLGTAGRRFVRLSVTAP